MNAQDRELLTLAARAADLPIEWYEGTIPVARIRPGNGGAPSEWNPLVDDGDALRLVVRLKQLDLWSAEAVHGIKIDGFYEEPYIATRRAIVRAAATAAVRSLT